MTQTYRESRDPREFAREFQANADILKIPARELLDDAVRDNSIGLKGEDSWFYAYVVKELSE